jgi:hypothetical protein
MRFLFLLILFFMSKANAQGFVPFAYWQNVSIPKLVQHKSNFATANNVSATFTSVVTSGNMLIACSASDHSAGIPVLTDTQNNIWSPIGISHVDQAQYCWEAPTAIAGATTVNVSSTGSLVTFLAIMEVSGGYTVLDEWGTASGTGTTVTLTTNAAIQNNTEYVFAVAYDWANNASWTQGAGYTRQEQINDASGVDSMALEDKDIRVNVSGTQTATFTKTAGSGTWNGFIFAFRQSPNAIVQALTISSSQVTAVNGTTNTFPINTTGSGNLLIIGVQQPCTTQTTQSLADNAPSGGNTYVSASAFSKATNAGGIDIYYAFNSKAGASTITWVSNGNCNASNFWFFEVSGMATSSPLDAVAVVNNPSSSTTITAPTVTTTKTRGFVVSMATAKNSIIDYPPSNSIFSQPYLTDFGDAAAIYFPVATGSYGGGWIQNVSGTYCASTAAFKSK